MKTKNVIIFFLLLFIAVHSLYAQSGSLRPADTPYRIRPIELEGPRVGVTFLSSQLHEYLEDDRDIDISPVISQFGWQFEKRFFALSTGTTAITEWIVLVGGVDQNLFIPSISWIIGMRSAGGFEFGVGPNLSVSGSSIVYAAGVTFHSNEINFPVNFAITPSTHGTRFTLLLGFNVRSR